MFLSFSMATPPTGTYTLSHTTLFRSVDRTERGIGQGTGVDRSQTIKHLLLPRRSEGLRRLLGFDTPDLVGMARPFADQLQDRKSTRLNSSHVKISYAVFCLKKKKLLQRVRQNYAESDALYTKALELEPRNEWLNGGYDAFRRTQKARPRTAG